MCVVCGGRGACVSYGVCVWCVVCGVVWVVCDLCVGVVCGTCVVVVCGVVRGAWCVARDASPGAWCVACGVRRAVCGERRAACALRGLHGAHAVDTRTLYSSFDAVGLQYGPGYRMVASVWQRVQCVARLRRRHDWQVTQVHPADLDGALQLGVVAMGSSGDIRLPFAVDRAALRGAVGDGVWAVGPNHTLLEQRMLMM